MYREVTRYVDVNSQIWVLLRSIPGVRREPNRGSQLARIILTVDSDVRAVENG